MITKKIDLQKLMKNKIILTTFQSVVKSLCIVPNSFSLWAN